MKKIHILLIEDNKLLRDGISSMLNKQKDMSVVGIISNGENILKQMDANKPDIVLLDLGLRNQNSLQIVKLIRQNFLEIKIIVLDLIPLQEDVMNFVRAGVSGFILKDADITEFIKSIRSVFQGTKVLPLNLTNSLFSQIVDEAVIHSDHSTINESVRLTKREKQVIDLIADGATNKEMANKLHLSIYTIKSHVHNILEKLTLHSRIQIAKHSYLSESSETATETTSIIDD
jgi:DNA-binding NarL/FixJ family response regulator